MDNLSAQSHNSDCCRGGGIIKALSSRSTGTVPITSTESSTVNYQIPDRRLQKSLTDQSDSEEGVGLNFRRSHTCGSLYAKCSCTTQSPSTTIANIDVAASRMIISAAAEVNSNRNKQSCDSGWCDSPSRAGTLGCRCADKKEKKLFQSYSHPDTSFTFTDQNKNADRAVLSRNKTSIVTKDGKVEISNSKRLSTPNIGNYAILDVTVHPEVVLTICTKNIHKKKSDCQKLHAKRPSLQKGKSIHTSTESDNSIDVSPGIETTKTSIEDDPYNCDLFQLDDDDEPLSDLDSRVSENHNYTTSATSGCYDDNVFSHQRKIIKEELDPAQRYFQESGILGPVLRKSSKIMQDSTYIEKIRRNSKIIRNNHEHRKLSTNEEMEYLREITSNLKMDKADCEEKIKSVEDELRSLRNILKSRDNEIYKLKREIHKLKSVLQQTTNHMPIADGDLLASLQTQRGMPGQQSEITSSCPNIKHVNNNNTPELGTSNDIGIVISSPYTNYNCQQAIVAPCGSARNGSIHSPNQLPPPTVLKKQGVSGESSDAASQQTNNVTIPKYSKDFRSKQLIKDAIMDNDFLKNIDSSQVRELVESMYSLKVAKGEYVIKERDAGAHLYVSAEGEFEVIKNGVVLGTMGPGKAFGELAILYNCTRTASIRVLCDSRVWVLDRRVFQQIMMRTGMQRIEDNVNFLKSVPLLTKLSNDVLSKIADVLEVEFYPAGTYIIRQGASGDTFFLISQGTVKVTQKQGSDEKELRTLGRGDYFGEQALINEDKRTANIIALTPGVECLTLDRESFTHLIGDLCELKEKNYGDYSKRSTSRLADEKSKEVFGRYVEQELLDLSLSDLEVVATLGIGGFGRVELVKCHREGRVETYALKCLKKKHIIDTRQEEHVFSERTIMLSCKTPFICRLHRTFRDSKYIYMLLEACMGGEVWTILRDRGCFDESTTQFIIGCVLQAFEYLHSRGIIYRDLKPENLMLDEKGYVKLVDFGFAKHIGPSNKTWTFCGTPEYVAPEIILNKGHDRAVDYWSLGILIHELLNGAPPFTASDPMKTYNIILKGIDMIDFPKHISRSAVTLIKKLCRDVPAERLGYQKGGIQDIKKHKWFQGFDWDGLSNLTLVPPFLRPISHSMDTSYFDRFPVDQEIPPDEVSGWDADF